MKLHHSGVVVVQGPGLTDNMLSVMIHRLCVSNEEIDYMWILAHFIGLLMSIFVCTYVGARAVACVCVAYIAEGSLRYSQPEEEGLMSQSQSIREAIKCPDESTGHSLCLVLPFTLFPPKKTPFHSPAPYLPRTAFLPSPTLPADLC